MNTQSSNCTRIYDHGHSYLSYTPRDDGTVSVIIKDKTTQQIYKVVIDNQYNTLDKMIQSSNPTDFFEWKRGLC